MTQFQPIIVIGAARSGTKVLRDCLATATGAGRVPYDVGYVWRHGNESCPHDQLQPSDVTIRTRRLVRHFIGRYAASDGSVVEKTVGNSLRPSYVAEILPEAKFVYIERDGVDVAVSTRREWQARTDLRYLVGKARHFPLRLAPTYGTKFIKAHTLDRRRMRGHVGTWGPRYVGIDEDLQMDGLLRVCARQWKASVAISSDGLAGMQQTVARVTYSDLVNHPFLSLRSVLQALDLPIVDAALDVAASMLDPTRSAPSRPTLTLADRSELADELSSVLVERGYDLP